MPIRELALQDPLPTLKGNDLNGHATELPRDVAGRLALLALGFTSGSRHDVEAWTERFRKTFGADSSVTYYEVPVLGGMARIMRPMIDGGMKKGTPAELRSHAITVWQGAGDWKRRVGFKVGDAAYLILLDRRGRVAWRYAGHLDETAWDSLAQALAAAR